MRVFIQCGAGYFSEKTPGFAGGTSLPAMGLNGTLENLPYGIVRNRNRTNLIQCYIACVFQLVMLCGSTNFISTPHIAFE